MKEVAFVEMVIATKIRSIIFCGVSEAPCLRAAAYQMS